MTLGSVITSILPLDTGTLKDRKRRKPKSMFPVLGKMENRGKQFLLEDLVTLAKLIYGKFILTLS